MYMPPVFMTLEIPRFISRTLESLSSPHIKASVVPCGVMRGLGWKAVEDGDGALFLL